MKFLLGTKQNMTQFFAEDGKAYPATIVNAGPVVVTQVKDGGKDGYRAVQVGYGHNKKIIKAQKGHFKDLGSFRHVKEYRILNTEEQVAVAVGDSVNVSAF